MKRLRWAKGQYDKGELVGLEKKKRASALKHPVRYGRATIKLTDEGLEQFTEAEWERIKTLAERVREEPIATNYNQLQVKLQPTGLDHLDMAFLRATGREL